MVKEIKSPIIIIPARLASQRLPNKPLAMIDGEAMIIRVWRLALAAAELCSTKVGVQVIVAAADKEIVEVIEAAGGVAVLTEPSLPSGTDRIYAALAQFKDNAKYDAVINLQGDLPLFDPQIIPPLLAALKDYPITTPVIEIDAQAAQRPDFVKAVLADENKEVSRALYFSRSPIPATAGDMDAKFFCHIGIYAYRREALAEFVRLPPAPLERRESLEQLRAFTNNGANNIDIGAVKLNKEQMPYSVDTAADIIAVESALKDNQ